MIYSHVNPDRKKKVERASRKVISDFLVWGFPDSDNIFWLINIGEIILSPDYSYLDINVSSFHNEDTLAKALAKHAHLVQREIGKQIWLRRSPKVRFRYDDSGKMWSSVIETIKTLDIN